MSSPAFEDIMGVILGEGSSKYGPWEDPRTAKLGGCGGAIPDIVWAADSEQLDAGQALLDLAEFTVELIRGERAPDLQGSECYSRFDANDE